MRDLHKIDTPDLIDMLSVYTEKFTHLFRGQPMLGFQQENYAACKKAIELITDELVRRRFFVPQEEQRMSA